MGERMEAKQAAGDPPKRHIQIGVRENEGTVRK